MSATLRRLVTVGWSALAVVTLLMTRESTADASDSPPFAVAARRTGEMLLDAYRDACPADPTCWANFVEMYYPGDAHPPWLDEHGHPR